MFAAKKFSNLKFLYTFFLLSTIFLCSKKWKNEENEKIHDLSSDTADKTKIKQKSEHFPYAKLIFFSSCFYCKLKRCFVHCCSFS